MMRIDDAADMKRQRANAAGRRHYVKNRAKILASQAQYRALNADKIKKRSHSYYEKNKERLKPVRKQWAKKNPDKCRNIDRKWKSLNRSKMADSQAKRRDDDRTEYRRRERDRYHHKIDKVERAKYTKTYRQENAALLAAHAAARRATRKRAMPPWVDRLALKEIYVEAARRGMTVDHIYPLKHPLCCGLHVPWNLQLLTLEQNISKHNRLPEEL